MFGRQREVGALLHGTVAEDMQAFFTIDTEYSSKLFRNGTARSCAENYARCIDCTTEDDAVGVRYQMDVFDRYGLTGVFFVDPMPALVWGGDAVRRLVDPILERGHDVQLHLHTEWLEFADRSPVGAARGRNLSDFTLAHQETLIDYAAEQLIAAGVPDPVAFRAGNYGADDDTLRALARRGIRIDTSFTPGLTASDCRIGLDQAALLPTRRHGVWEFPVGAIAGRGESMRHAQLTALSFWELAAAIGHAAATGWPAFVLVSHSFELMNRDRGIANRIVKKRFERFCDWLAHEGGIRSARFSDRASVAAALMPPSAAPSLLPHNSLRTFMRVTEQAGSDLLYGSNRGVRVREVVDSVKHTGWRRADLLTAWNDTVQAASALVASV